MSRPSPEVPVPEEAEYEAAVAFTDTLNPHLGGEERQDEISALSSVGMPEALQAAAPFIAAKAVEEEEKQLRECEEALRSAEANYAQFRDDMLNELRGDTGDSIETLSWDQLLGVAIRNGNAAMKAEDFLEKMRRAIADCRSTPAQRNALADRLESILDQEADHAT